MSILLYAISRDDARAPAAGELQEICAAGLRALAEPVQQPLAADLEELVHYEETVEAVMQRHTILPMRFGSVVDDEQEVRELLKTRAREFATALGQLDGAVEFGVQASIRTSSDSDAPSGSAAAGPGETGPAETGPGESYMRARLQEQIWRRELQSWLDSALGEVVRRRVFRVTPVCGPNAISAAFLIDQTNQERFLQMLAQLAEAGDHTLSWSGPWPPYTFVEALDP